LNYGYAVVRSYIARSLVTAGFHPTFGIAKNIEMPLELVSERINEMGKFIPDRGNAIFYSIDILENDGPKKAYEINMSCVINYISLLLLVDTIINPIEGFAMQVCARNKSFMNREEILKKIRELNKKK